MYFGADYYPEHWPRERWETDAKLMQEAGFCHVTCRKDLAGLDRVVSGVYDKE